MSCMFGRPSFNMHLISEGHIENFKLSITVSISRRLLGFDFEKLYYSSILVPFGKIVVFKNKLRLLAC